MDELSKPMQVDPQTARQNLILSAVRTERQYQNDKYGAIEERPHSVGEWLLIMEAELDEAKFEWCKGDGIKEEDALREVLQVIAVGFACLEQHGIVYRE